ncbi:MAG: site-specific integrase [Candidatus Poribacteria bacterium]|nr:site-specific integrase [Candidatus Poribacteria bacterium]
MKGMRPLENHEVRKILNYFKNLPTQSPKGQHLFPVRNRSLFVIGLQTGLRIGEICQLKIGDVYGTDNKVSPVIRLKKKQTKSKESRIVPLSNTAQRAIRECIAWQREYFGHIEMDNPLFPTRTKTHFSQGSASEVITRIFRACNIKDPVNTHSLRKTFATKIYQKTGNLRVCQELLGHKDLTSTQKYIGVTYTEMNEAVNAIGLAY